MSELEPFSKTYQLRLAILKHLMTVIDPETGVDVVRMRLIEDLTVDESGRVSYKFRPSSFLCPVAVPLSIAIQQAVSEVEGVTEQDMEIAGYIQADELTELIKQAVNAKWSQPDEHKDEARVARRTGH
jgi:metal-sulfur cluster biosynthetic enzyme